MIKFNNFPPEGPEDVAFTPGALIVIEGMDGGGDQADHRLYVTGEAVGRILYANMLNPDITRIREIGYSLTERLDNKPDIAFHQGLTHAVEQEHSIAIYSSTQP